MSSSSFVWPSLIITAIGRDSFSPPSIFSAPVSPDMDSRALRCFIMQDTLGHCWTRHAISEISHSLFQLPSTQSLLVRVLTIEAWWNTQIQKQLMELPTRHPSLGQVRTDIVLWSLFFPAPDHLVTFCRAFTRLRSVQLVRVRWEHPWVSQRLDDNIVRSCTPVITKLHILGSALMSVRLSTVFQL